MRAIGAAEIAFELMCKRSMERKAFGRELARLGGNFDVIAIDYRMGPEFRFPTAINDAITSINWINNNSLKLPIDTSKIAVCGDSAGGNIATVCCLHSKINSGPLISFANNALLDWTGFESKNILGLPLSNIFGSKKLRVLVERLYAIIQSGGVYEFTNNLKCLNGSEIECSWQVSCIYDEDGVATNFLLTVYRNVNKLSLIHI